MSAGSTYVLQASYVFCMSTHLFISVLEMFCNVVVCAVGWGCGAASCCRTKQGREGREAPAWEGYSSLITFGWKAVPALEQEQLHFIPATPQVSWLVCVQYNHSWEVLCGP